MAETAVFGLILTWMISWSSDIATSDQDMAVSKASKVGVSVANHHARILYGPFSVVWNLHPAQITLIQRTFFEELLSHAHV